MAKQNEPLLITLVYTMADCGKCGFANGEMEDTCGRCGNPLVAGPEAKDTSRSRSRERERREKERKERDTNDGEEEAPKWAMSLMRKMDKVAGQVGVMNDKVEKAVDMATKAKEAAGRRHRM